MVIGGNFDGAIVYILTLIYVLFWPYLFCYFANLAVDRIELNQRTVYNLNWYNFPPDLRKYFILIMAQSQRTVCFDGLSLVRCIMKYIDRLWSGNICHFSHTLYELFYGFASSLFAADSVINLGHQYYMAFDL